MFLDTTSIQMTGRRVVVVGGGVIGLSIAWRSARAGAHVTVIERDRVGAGASRAAAGMLAPITEAGHGHGDQAMTRFARASLARYRSFAAELEADADSPVTLDTRGTLIAALDRDDVEAVRRAFEHRRALGLPVEWLAGAGAREKEPLLSPRTSAAMWIPDDHQVDTRGLLEALLRACTHRGVVIRESAEVSRVLVRDGAVAGVRTTHDDAEAEVVVMAAGAWSGAIDGIPAGAVAPVRPVKGQIVRLRGAEHFPLAHVIRSPRVYVLPKTDGSVLVGATQEEMGFDVRPTAGAVKDLLEHAWELLPAIYELAFEGVEVGLRPASRDHLPIIGPTRVRGLVMATGHFRSGILLAPATADAVVEGIASGRFGDLVAAFSPERFG
ncbi:MAG TPA: glycine oxidase ThiO [Candidatus Krumholzibacteria bacterium]|nr:glycine oxidase ThiO [Candidatus Krumholzibacteria bacterium]